MVMARDAQGNQTPFSSPAEGSLRTARQVDRLRAAHEAAGGAGDGPGAGVVVGMGNRAYPHQTVLAPPLVAALLHDLAL